MSNTLRITGILVGLFLSTVVLAQNVNLTPYLQAETNEVAMLLAQANYLQQQGDPLGAAVVASYVPDHQMQIAALTAYMQQHGGMPTAVTAAAVMPVMGTRSQILLADLNGHKQAMDSYARLARNSDPTIKTLAMMGQNGATRHYESLQVAKGMTDFTPGAIRTATLAALSLEIATVDDLNMQSARLTALGDTTTATMLMNMVAAHQQQVTNLQTLVSRLGGNPKDAMTIPLVALNSRADIIAHFKVVDTQFVNTYAIALNVLPPSPLAQAFAQVQTLALTSLASLQRLPVA